MINSLIKELKANLIYENYFSNLKNLIINDIILQFQLKMQENVKKRDNNN